MNLPQPRACAVCGRVLDYHEGSGWAHTSLDQVDADHPAVPVPVEDIELIGRCDFCSEDYPAWVLECDAFQVLPGHMSATGWACCDRCAGSIRMGRWNQLLRRAVESLRRCSPELFASPSSSQLQEMAIRRLHRGVRKHMHGGPRPLPARPETPAP